MSEWKGLDPGGTEQLWEPDVLINVLRLMKIHEPFSRGDPTSPLYSDLENEFEDITWRSTDADGTFRPIFRKTNPWGKLGLTTLETQNSQVTPFGEELISGETTTSEVFTQAAKAHREPDGTPSFAIMCRAALQLPDEIFTLRDIEFALSKAYADRTKTLEDALNFVRRGDYELPVASRRTRTLKAFMNVLVSAGAMAAVADGWALYRNATAEEIASQSASSVSADLRNVTVFDASESSGRSYSYFSEVLPGPRTTSSFSVNAALPQDPIQRALLLEKANSIHESLIEDCAAIVRSLGLRPVEDPASFDLAVIDKQLIFEMKSINNINAISQLRKAIAQLPEYRWRHRNIFQENTSCIIILSQNPFTFLDRDYLDYIQRDRGISVFWRINGDFYNHSNSTLMEFLSAVVATWESIKI